MSRAARMHSAGIVLILVGIAALGIGSVMLGAVSAIGPNCGTESCNLDLLLFEAWSAIVLLCVGAIAVPLGLVLYYQKRWPVLGGLLVLFFVLAIFLPFIPLSVPTFDLGELYGDCYGLFGRQSTRIYVSMSYLLSTVVPSFNGQFGVVLAPGGMPPIHNGTMVFFPLYGANRSIICA